MRWWNIPGYYWRTIGWAAEDNEKEQVHSVLLSKKKIKGTKQEQHNENGGCFDEKTSSTRQREIKKQISIEKKKLR